MSTKIHIVKTMVFPVVMYGCKIWTIKKADCWRIDAFELRYWRQFLRIPWTAKRSNQSIPNEINPEYSLEGLMWNLRLQYFGHLMRRADNSLEKTLMLGKIEGRRRRGWQRIRKMVGWHHQLNGHEFGQTPGRQGILACSSSWVPKSQTWLSDWTTTITPSETTKQIKCNSVRPKTWYMLVSQSECTG